MIKDVEEQVKVLEREIRLKNRVINRLVEEAKEDHEEKEYNENQKDSYIQKLLHENRLSEMENNRLREKNSMLESENSYLRRNVSC